jgi:hypothetical protein
MRAWRHLCGATVAVLVLQVAVAEAQAPRIEVSVGVVGDAGVSAGTTRAELIDGNGQVVPLFTATHRTAAALGLDARVSLRLRGPWLAELSGGWTRPELRSAISSDLDGADDTVATLGTHRVVVELGVVRRFGRAGRFDPYVRASAGWLRELTADRALVDDGVAAQVGGGLKYWMRDGQPGWLGRVALRTDIRLAVRRGGLSLGETGTTVAPAVSVGLIIGR